MQPDMNGMMRRAGNRSRALPDIGQLSNTPAVQQAAPPPTPPPTPTQPGPAAAPAQQSPMAAPNVQPSTFTLHPPGSPADSTQYNYEPQPDGSWRVYPPGVGAPPHTFQASLPRAASTADYRRMRQAFQQTATP